MNNKFTNKEFVMPKAQIIVFETEDVITTSTTGGGFNGEWDDLANGASANL